MSHHFLRYPRVIRCPVTDSVILHRFAPEQAENMAQKAEGVIVGSAIVKIVAKYGKDCEEPVCSYIREMKSATQRAEGN